VGTIVRSFRVRASLKDVVRTLSKEDSYSSVYVKVFEDARIAVLIGEKLFLRTGSWAGITLVIKESSPTSCVIDAIGFAGGRGLLNISWFSEESYIEELMNFLRKHYEVEEL